MSEVVSHSKYIKRTAALLSVLMILFLPGCREKSFSFADGMYVPERIEADRTVVPFLLIKDGSMRVIDHPAVSYQPSGSITVKENKIVMKTQFLNESCKWTFILTNNNTLDYSSGESHLPEGWENWKDGMRFIRAEE